MGIMTMIILKSVLRRQGVNIWARFTVSEQGPMAASLYADMPALQVMYISLYITATTRD